MDGASKKPKESLMVAMKKAQILAFAPLLFQATQELVKRGILEALIEAGAEGLDTAEVSSQIGISTYGAAVLLEAGLAVEALSLSDGKFRITKLGYLLARDPMTRANMNFSADVCYGPARHLGASIDEGRAAGLAELGDWPTVYEGLSKMGEPARSSWFEFDHFYSDDSFPLVIPLVLEHNPRRILDIGGNTGKFARAIVAASAVVHHTICDLPGQIELAKAEMVTDEQRSRISYYPVDLLDPTSALPTGFDVVWMSQFLCCFSEREIVSILQRARRAVADRGRLMIMDNFWDVQENEVSALCVQATSLYFTCVANGNSRMYDYRTMERLIGEAGLKVIRATHAIGLGHSLVECAGLD
jgi:SAM-dependent methyltransferase